MRRNALSFIVALGLMLLGAVNVASAAGSPTIIPLTMSQASAFSVLGHSCGGIRVQTIAAGFDPTSGYPVGYAYLYTSCSSGGRGSHPSIFTAWTQITWDFTGATVHFSVVAGPPSSVDPNATTTDANGNEVYTNVTAANPPSCTASDTTTCSFSAQLSRSATYTPIPRVTSISTTVGPTAGGQTITVTGTGFTSTTAVRFGGAAAVTFKVASDTALTAVSPLSAAGTVAVTVTSAGGTSSLSPLDEYTFVAAPKVTSIMPRAGPATGGSWVTLSGHHLSRTTSVDFGGAQTGFSVLSDSSLSVYVPATDSYGPATVLVSSPGGSSTADLGATYVYAPSSCTTSNPCESSATCAKITGSLKAKMTLSACTPKSRLNASATFTVVGGTFKWATGGRTTVVYLSTPLAVGRGACASGRTEEDLFGAVIGGSSTYAQFGDPVVARLCVSATKSVSIVPKTAFQL